MSSADFDEQNARSAETGRDEASREIRASGALMNGEWLIKGSRRRLSVDS